jgi:aryl carrier-like protein
MADLVTEVRALLPTRPRSSLRSKATLQNRANMLELMASQLLDLGFREMTVLDLDIIHVSTLIALWEKQGIKIGTQFNRLAVLRWWAMMIGKKDMLGPHNNIHVQGGTLSPKPDLISDLKRLALNRSRFPAVVSHNDRLRQLIELAEQLAILGYDDLTAKGLDVIHIVGLVEFWKSQDIDIRIQAGYLVELRWWARRIGKKDIISPYNGTYGLPRIPKESFSKNLDRVFAEDIPPHKMCRKCLKDKDLDQFPNHKHSRDGYGNTCLQCGRERSAIYRIGHKEDKRVYDAAHKLERRLGDLSRRHGLSRTDPKLLEFLNNARTLTDYEFLPFPESSSAQLPDLFPQSCVYFIQILSRENTLKIGQSVAFSGRFHALQKQYGLVRIIMLIPSHTPWNLEKLFHRHFIHERLYSENGGLSELFQFTSRTAQRRLEIFMKKFPDYLVSPLQWVQPPPQVDDLPTKTQLSLF